MITQAAERLKDVAIQTPLLESPLLNNALGFRLLIKPECLQKTGSFKIRGAYNKIASLDETQRKAGVVAYSSGNHAQGVAAAASAMGVAAKNRDALRCAPHKTGQHRPLGGRGYHL